LTNNHRDEKINLIDGLRIDYDDGWVILRPSGTEEKFRITSESKEESTSEQRAKSFKKEFESIYDRLKS